MTIIETPAVYERLVDEEGLAQAYVQERDGYVAVINPDNPQALVAILDGFDCIGELLGKMRNFVEVTGAPEEVAVELVNEVNEGSVILVPSAEYGLLVEAFHECTGHDVTRQAF